LRPFKSTKCTTLLVSLLAHSSQSTLVSLECAASPSLATRLEAVRNTSSSSTQLLALSRQESHGALASARQLASFPPFPMQIVSSSLASTAHRARACSRKWPSPLALRLRRGLSLDQADCASGTETRAASTLIAARLIPMQHAPHARATLHVMPRSLARMATALIPQETVLNLSKLQPSAASAR
jgi:hypothetical protein